MDAWDDAQKKAASLRNSLGQPEWLTNVVVLTHPDYDSTQERKPAIFVAYHPDHPAPANVPAEWEGVPVILIQEQFGSCDV